MSMQSDDPRVCPATSAAEDKDAQIAQLKAEVSELKRINAKLKTGGDAIDEEKYHAVLDEAKTVFKKRAVYESIYDKYIHAAKDSLSNSINGKCWITRILPRIITEGKVSNLFYHLARRFPKRFLRYYPLRATIFRKELLLFFDAAYYLRENPEVARSGVNPQNHFLRTGIYQNLEFNPLFDVSYYLRNNPDVRHNGIPAFIHYLQNGERENRQTHPLFSPQYYIKSNIDVCNSKLAPFRHYLVYGRSEGRIPHPALAEVVQAWDKNKPFGPAEFSALILNDSKNALINQNTSLSLDERQQAVAALNKLRQRREASLKQLASQPTKIRSVVQYVHMLYPGGAERQMCYLAAGLKAKGIKSRVYCQSALNDVAAHYLPYLRQNNVHCSSPVISHSQALKLLSEDDIDHNILSLIPEELVEHVLNLYAQLRVDKPDVLNSWLDYNNIVAAWAGVLAEVPLIVLSTRNYNPSNFIQHTRWMRGGYYRFMNTAGVCFVANSKHGAEDYANWLGADIGRFSVILNGIDTKAITPANEKTKVAFYNKHNINRDLPVLAGVFRLAKEKRPLLFLNIVKELLKDIPQLQVLLAGSGEMREEVEKEITKLGLSQNVKLLGRIQDVPTLLCIADCMLLTSDLEGTPNAVIEAQLLGCPVVASDTGGIAEIINHGETGYIWDIDDHQSAISLTRKILTDSKLRKVLSNNAIINTPARFSIDRFINESVQDYQARYSKICHHA